MHQYAGGLAPLKYSITLECRKREGVEDVTWIEQLATKRDHIGAAKTIAVSSSGFTAPAKKAAEIAGIELRRFRDISGEDLARQFLTSFSISLLVTTYKVIEFGLVDFEGLPINPDDLSDDLQQRFAGAGSLDAPLLRETSTGNELTLREISASQIGKIELKPGGKEKVKIDLKFNKPLWTVDLRDGPKIIGLLDVVVEYSYEQKPALDMTLRQYDRAAGETIMEVVQGDVLLSDEKRMQITAFVRRGDQPKAGEEK